MNITENPGLKTMISFLDQVKRNEPVNFSTLCEGWRRGYGRVSCYLRYCFGHGLIRVVSERRASGRYPSKVLPHREGIEAHIDIRG